RTFIADERASPGDQHHDLALLLAAERTDRFRHQFHQRTSRRTSTITRKISWVSPSKIAGATQTRADPAGLFRPASRPTRCPGDGSAPSEGFFVREVRRCRLRGMIDWVGEDSIRNTLSALAVVVSVLSLVISYRTAKRVRAERSVVAWITLARSDMEWWL